MRTTKALLCAAAIAAGAVSAMAQSSNVYSLNVVGYINLSLTNGWNLVANQLDVDGNMTNNTLSSVFGTSLPNNSQVYAYAPGSGYSSVTWLSGKWIGTAQASNAVNVGLQPGHGVFVKLGGSSPTNITLVGNVVQGTNVFGVASGYQILSSVPPVSGGVASTMGYVPTGNDQFLFYRNGGYQSATYLAGKWIPATPGEPVASVGEAFFLKAAKATNWVQGFTVQ